MQTPVEKLNGLLEWTWNNNPFYQEKWGRAGLHPEKLDSVEILGKYPFTSRDELMDDLQRHPPLGANLSVPLSDIKRIYQSSGTSGTPIFWGDTHRTFELAGRCSRELFQISGVIESDRLFIFSRVGGHSGAWIIHEGAVQLGASIIHCSLDRVDEAAGMLARFQPSVLVGHPIHLLHLAESLESSGIRSRRVGVHRIICTGESLKEEWVHNLDALWAARILDRYGLTEAGSIAAECDQARGVRHIVDTELIVESIDSSGKGATPGELGEVVVTTLGRVDRPVIRFKTGDHGRLVHGLCKCGRFGFSLLGPVFRNGKE